MERESKVEYYEKTVEKLTKEFRTSTQGLTQHAVDEQRQRYGKNRLREKKREHWTVTFLRQFKSILIYILFAAAVISLAVGKHIDAGVIFFILVLNGTIGFVQERKAQASIHALEKLTSAQATVLREGKTLRIQAEELVPGDIIILETGDKVPADARIIKATLLEVQEGMLTGESATVRKTATTLSGRQAIGDQENMVFSGTNITKGRGQALVIATGMKTEIGKIAQLVQEAPTDKTHLEHELDKLGAWIGKVVLSICAGIFVVLAIILQSIVEPLMLAVTMAVSAIPEGLPVVVTIALAIGTERMVAKNALIKKLVSVETLGSTTVICTDKTGTLTKNEMTVVAVSTEWGQGKVTGTGYAPHGEIHAEVPALLIQTACLCNDATLQDDHAIIGDPTEACLITLTRKASEDEKTLLRAHPRIGEIPFTSERKRMTTINAYDQQLIAHTKGAVDVLLEHCTRILTPQGERELTNEDKKRILAQNDTYAHKALRVLGFAYKDIERKQEYDEQDEKELAFIGMVGIRDPPREEVKQAILTCESAGIRVVMITGDHENTATAIARELGIPGRVVRGEEITDMQLHEIADVGVFARVNPEHKMRIVDALREQGEIVAMTGDGVNDAPALKHADIGVAMGVQGTEVAKESADMILTDDNFASIVEAVHEGRSIYTNIKKFVSYLLSSNLGEILAIVLVLLFIRQEGSIVIPLTATMILLMNLVTDGLPALALSVDPAHGGIMRQKPRDPKAALLTRNLLINTAVIGLLIGVCAALAFWWAIGRYETLAHAQTIALTVLVALQIVRIAMIRQQYGTPFFTNAWLLYALVAVIAIQAAIIYVPAFNTLIGTAPLLMVDWGVIAFATLACYLVGTLLSHLLVRVAGQDN